MVQQAQKGTHYGAGHELEVRWGELVQEIVPSAEAVKFVSSGTEATMLAIRLARAFTGRDRVIKVNGHFHGWHDYAVVAMAPPYDVPISIGMPKGVQDTVTGIDDKDADALEAELAKGDVAAVIIWCNALTKEWAETVRDKAKAHGALVIYDEVVTGFRYAPGGAQEYFGVKPDLTTLAKIVAGGLPGGAIAGRADVIHQFDFSDDPKKQRFGRVAHPGTYNGNPLSAAAGVACLEIVRDPKIQDKAADTATKIKAGFQDALKRTGVEGAVGGWRSYITTSAQGEGQRLGAAAQVAGRDAAWRRRSLGHEPDRLGGAQRRGRGADGRGVRVGDPPAPGRGTGLASPAKLDHEGARPSRPGPSSFPEARLPAERGGAA